MRSISLKDNSRYYFDKTKIMGIVNNTPDSFFPGSRSASSEAAVERALKMIADGADIIDIGGESTRPGCDPITTEEEIERVVSVVKGIRRINKDILISVDTYRSETAEAAIIAGADIINDISAMMFDEHMADVVKKYNVPVILMHIKGTPKNMQQNPQYENLMGEVTEFFNERVAYALSKDIDRDKLILDPGVGFGKQYEHNIELIKKVGDFHQLDLPILLAVSRKSSIGTALGNLPPEQRLEGTIAVTCYAVLNDIEMVRVHDVAENKRAALMTEVLK